MPFTNLIKDALHKSESTEFSINFANNMRRSSGFLIDASVPPKMPEEMRVMATSSESMRQMESVSDNNAGKTPEQPEGSIATQAETIQEVQTPNSNIPQQSDQSLDLKAFTSRLNAENSFLAAIEKHQENNLKHQDKLQIQYIQNHMQFVQPIPLNNNVGVKVKPPLDAFPSLWPDLITSIACSLNVPEETVISGLLAAVYTAIRGKYKVEVLKDYLEALTEYFIVVMPSGSKKSAIVRALKIPLDKYIEKRQVEFDNKASDKKIIKQLIKKIEKKHIKNCADQMEGKSEADIDLMLKNIEETLHPLKDILRDVASRPNLFNDFPTMKKLGENMQAQNEFIAIFDAEAGVWKCRVFSKDDMILLKAYTMEYFGNETATNGSVSMQSPCVVICSYIQPGVALELYSNEDLKDDGLLPRILPLFCLSKPAIQNTIPQDINPELMAMYESKISSILEYCWDKRRTANRAIEVLQLTHDARQEFLNFSHTVSVQIHDGNFEDCKEFASKLAGHAVRLAGAVHFLEHDKPWENPISLSAMRAGIALAEFFANHALFAFDKKQNDAFLYATKILKWAKRHRVVNFDQRDAQRGVGHCKIGQIEAGIDLLIKNNYLAQHHNYKGNMVYIVNPNSPREGE